MATCSVNINVRRSSSPTSNYHQSLLKDCPRCDAPLAVCVSVVTTCMYVCVFPQAFSYCGSVTLSPLSNSIFDPSLKPGNLVSPVCPHQQQQAWWHSRWQWPQERRVHPQQQSTLAPYRHRPLDEAICRGHLWGDDIISSQPIKMSWWKSGVFSMLFRGRLQSLSCSCPKMFSSIQWLLSRTE